MTDTTTPEPATTWEWLKGEQKVDPDLPNHEGIADERERQAAQIHAAVRGAGRPTRPSPYVRDRHDDADTPAGDPAPEVSE